MAEDFTGVTPINEPIKPDQETLRDKQPVIELGDISAMDAAAKELMEKKDKEAEEQEAAEKKAAEEAEAARKAEENKTEEEKAAEAEAAKKAEEEKAAQDAKTEEEKAAEEAAAKAAEETKAAEEAKAAEDGKKAGKSDDPYPDIELPANKVTGESAKAFASLKERFAADLAKRDEEIQQLKGTVEQFQAKPVPEDIKKELEDLRVFRAKLDLQADPNFSKKYDGKIESMQEFLYAQLKSSGSIGDEHIKKIRDLGGLDKVNYEQILEKIDNPQVVRLVQGKLDEIAVLRFEKKRALEVAQGDVQKYVEERQKEYEGTVHAHQDNTNAELEKLYQTKMKWMHETKLADTASADERKLHEEAVKFSQTVKGHMAVALQDDSPQMRAVLIAGMGELLHTKELLKREAAARESAEKALKVAETELGKIKKASVTKLRESSAPPDGKLPKPKLDYNTTAAEALDAHRKAQLGT